MTVHDLIPGRLYKLRPGGTIAEFSRVGGTGKVIFHPPGEPDMQSSFAVGVEDVVCEVTREDGSRPMTAQDLAARLRSFNPLVVGSTVYVPAFVGGFGTAADCLREIAAASGTAQAAWRREQPCKNACGYWMMIVEERG